MSLNIHSIDKVPEDSAVVDRVRKTLIALRRSSFAYAPLGGRIVGITPNTDLLIGVELGLNNCLVIGAPDNELVQLCQMCDEALGGPSLIGQTLKIVDAHNACWNLFRSLTLRDEVIEE